jgi:putative addiction module killer protein
MNTINKTDEFDAWLSGLGDLTACARVLARVRRAELGNFGDVESVGGGVTEMRVDFGPGYRVYFGREGRVVYLLLCGGVSGGDKSTQKADIKRAKAMWATIQKEQS